VDDSERKTAQTTILVVDDNQDIRDFTQIALEAAGYGVHTATEGVQALAMQRERPADVLVTDIFMPGREGISTIAGFKAEFAGTRIIAMSAGGGTGKHDFLSAAKLIGADATLRKPFTADQLLDAVRKVLQPP
jgi:DNA-binding NtrC family response regulator